MRTIYVHESSGSGRTRCLEAGMKPEGICGNGGKWKYKELTGPIPAEKPAGDGEGSSSVASEIGHDGREQPEGP